MNSVENLDRLRRPAIGLQLGPKILAAARLCLARSKDRTISEDTIRGFKSSHVSLKAANPLSANRSDLQDFGGSGLAAAEHSLGKIGRFRACERSKAGCYTKMLGASQMGASARGQRGCSPKPCARIKKKEAFSDIGSLLSPQYREWPWRISYQPSPDVQKVQ